MDVSTKKLLPDLITNCSPGGNSEYVSWLPDNAGFLYLHFPVIDIQAYLKNTKSVYYKLGQNTGQLNEVFSSTNNRDLNIQPEDFPVVSINNQDSKYIIGEIAREFKYYGDTYYAKMINPSESKYDWKFLFSKEEKISFYIIKGFLSGKNASNFQICKTALNNPDFKNPIVLVKKKKEEVIQSMAMTIDGLFYVTTKSGVEAKLYHFKDGIETEIEMPEISGNIFIESKGDKYSDLWVSTMGWLNGGRRYKYDFENKRFEEANLVPIIQFPEFEDLVVKEVLVKSHDGVEVPLSIIHKKGIEMNGKNPVILHGYGAYGISLNPFFSPNWLLFAEEGGVLTFAHVRGGGEKGQEWYNAGKKMTKPNTWKDFIACTEYLIEQAYTERPDLFAAVISQVGCMNMMRAEAYPNGVLNANEYGTIENPEECKALFEMDPYQHLKKEVDYPATLLTAGINSLPNYKPVNKPINPFYFWLFTKQDMDVEILL